MPASPSGNCDPDCSGYCAPIVSDDLDCADVEDPVHVTEVDSHNFDSDGDGYGCDTYG
jgi:hypothetical protein